jgi:hypothetical protein
MAAKVRAGASPMVCSRPGFDGLGAKFAAPMPDRAASDKFERRRACASDNPPLRQIARVTPDALGAMATLDKLRADSRLPDATQVMAFRFVDTAARGLC